MVTFSKSLIDEYKAEMSQTYGVFVSDADAQIQLLRLVRSMFPTVIAEHKTESRESSAMLGLPACADSLSVSMSDDGRNEVEASITSTSGQDN